MLRLTALTLAGLYGAFMVFGQDLSAEEQATYDAAREKRVSLVTLASDRLLEAFGEPSRRRGDYVPTLASLEQRDDAADTPAPTVATARRSTASTEIDSMVQLASFDTGTTTATTRVTNPEKLDALLHPAAATTAPLPSDSSDTALRQVSATRVNVRSGPSTATAVLGQVEQADIVQLVSPVQNGWVKISVQGAGVEGYMAARFLSPIGQ
nr:SH3 domain-containing protein [uncultured Celeribacter sp.]